MPIAHALRAAFILALFLAVPAQAQSVAEQVGVQIQQAAGNGLFSHGSGVVLDGSMVLTAAHVVAHNATDPRVTVVLGGRALGARIVRDGKAAELDLALLRLDQPLATPAVAPCRDNPGTNAPVLVAGQGKVTPARTVGTPISAKAQTTSGWTNLLNAGFHQGNSGGGVFDPARGCLWGIITHLLSGPSLTDGRHLELTAFAPALDVAGFLAGR